MVGHDANGVYEYAGLLGGYSEAIADELVRLRWWL